MVQQNAVLISPHLLQKIITNVKRHEIAQMRLMHAW